MRRAGAAIFLWYALRFLLKIIIHHTNGSIEIQQIHRQTILMKKALGGDANTARWLYR